MPTDDRRSAPFNMALFTLEKIHNILKRIAEISTAMNFDGDIMFSLGQSQHMKYRLIRQLFIQSIPLFNKEKKDKIQWKESMAQRIGNIKLISGDKIKNNQIVGKFQGFTQEIEDELDNITIDIQETLQDEGYFMPSRNDPKHSWKKKI